MTDDARRSKIANQIRSRTIRILLGSVTIVLVVGALFFGPRLILPRITGVPGVSNDDAWRPMLAWGAFYAVMLVIYVTSMLRMWRMSGRYREFGDRTCPHCLVGLNGDDDQSLSCPSCEQSFRLGDLEHFWTGFGEKGMKELPPGLPRPSMRRTYRTVRKLEKNVWFAILAGLMVMGATFLLPRLADSRFTWVQLIATLPVVMTFGIGTGLALYGVMRRKGTELSCIQCGYEKHAEATARRCPECAAWWAEDELLPRGMRHRSYVLVGLGMVLVMASMPMMFTVEKSIVRSSLSLQSNRSVINQLSKGSTMYANDAWGALLSRDQSGDLTGDDIEMLTDVLIDQRHELSLPLEAHAWLRDEMLASPEHPRFGDWVHTMIIVEEGALATAGGGPVTVGVPTEIQLRIHAVSDMLPTHDIGLVVDAIVIDGTTSVPSAPCFTTMKYVSMMTRAMGFFRFTWPVETITIDEPGEHRVTVQYTQILIPRPFGKGNGVAVTRDGSGAVEMPADGVGRSEGVFEFTINVAPAK